MKIITGEVSGSITAKQLPNISFESLNIHAQSSNAGNVYFGTDTVVKASGITGTTAGRGLSAGQDFWVVNPGNLSLIWIICDNAGDDIEYIVFQ